MKLFSTISGILFGLLICACGGYAFYMYGIPYLDAQSQYTKNIPNIEALTTECNQLNKTIDSLVNVNDRQRVSIEYLTTLVETTREQLLQTNISNNANKKVIDKLMYVEQQLGDKRLVIIDTVYMDSIPRDSIRIQIPNN